MRRPATRWPARFFRRNALIQLERTSVQPMTEPNRSGQSTVVVATATPIDIARQGSVRERAAAVTLATVMVLGLTKLIVGLAIGSLALVADAMHSGLDFVAAVLTLLAVRWASRPPDADHPYGHGRAENLSALVQALLLVAVAIGIGVEAVERIASNAPPVQPDRLPSSLSSWPWPSLTGVLGFRGNSRPYTTVPPSARPELTSPPTSGARRWF